MGRKKRRNEERKECWYCERTFSDEVMLVNHQRTKHFKCPNCHKLFNSAPAMATHASQVHQLDLKGVPAAIPGKDSLRFEILGMQGIPDDAGPPKRPNVGAPFPPPVAAVAPPPAAAVAARPPAMAAPPGFMYPPPPAGMPGPSPGALLGAPPPPGFMYPPPAGMPPPGFYGAAAPGAPGAPTTPQPPIETLIYAEQADSMEERRLLSPRYSKYIKLLPRSKPLAPAAPAAPADKEAAPQDPVSQ